MNSFYHIRIHTYAAHHQQKVRVSIKTAVSLENNTPVVWAPSLSSDSFGKHVSAQREAA